MYTGKIFKKNLLYGVDIVMKKFFSIIASILTLTFVISTSTFASAKDDNFVDNNNQAFMVNKLSQENASNKINKSTDNGLYLVSKYISDDVIQYAESQKDIVFSSLKDVLSNQLDSYETISYGNAFKLNNIDYIPIVSNGKVISLLGIVEIDGEYGWSLSEDFSDGLNKIANITSLQNPARLYSYNGNVYAIISDETYQLSFNPEIQTVDIISTRNTEFNNEIVNILDNNSKTETRISSNIFSNGRKILILFLLLVAFALISCYYIREKI